MITIPDPDLLPVADCEFFALPVGACFAFTNDGQTKIYIKCVESAGSASSFAVALATGVSRVFPLNIPVKKIRAELRHEPL